MLQSAKPSSISGLHSEFEKTIGVTFTDKSLLCQALTHRSYGNENPSHKIDDNERLELLGDSVIELVTIEYLFRRFPQEREGRLTAYRMALVSGAALAKVGEDLGISRCLLMAVGQSREVGKSRDVLAANAVEALVAAVHLDQGFEASKNFVLRHVVIPRMRAVIEGRLWTDPKSQFQELAQERFKVTPHYKVLRESGLPHEKVFLVGLYLGESLVIEGSGRSKQEAEQKAAKNALEKKEYQ